MHKERILDLADFLENEVSDKRFNMRYWVCGTAACIGGWCEARQQDLNPGDNLERHLKCGEEGTLPAEVYLGLNDEQEQALFYPHFANANCFAEPMSPAFITRTRAIATLRNLAETGEVVW